MWVRVIICTFIYAGLQYVYLKHQTGVLELSSHLTQGPFSQLAKQLGLAWLMTLIYVDVVVNPSGAALMYTGTTSRLKYALGEMRCAPQSFMKLNQFGVPHYSLMFNF